MVAHPAGVRPVADGDLPRLAEIYEHYVRHTAITFDLEVPPVTLWRERFAAARAARHPWLLVEDGGRVAGYASTGTFRPKPAWHPTVETSIYLAQDAVGRGLGRTLYPALLRAAAGAGFHVAIAGITQPNPASVALHEDLGFEPAGVFREVGMKLGEWRDVAWWQLRL